MNIFRYILRSLYHYRNQHLALFLGMAVSAAVLTGALIVGDSVSYSLRSMVESRLGKTKFAVISGSRFVDSQLASRLSMTLGQPVAPVLMLRGIAINNESGDRINEISIMGIDSSFNAISPSPLPGLADNEAIININSATRLALNVGDELLLRVENAGLVPVNSPLSKEPTPTVAMRLTIKAVADESQAGMFNLSNNQSENYNVFVNLKSLGNRMELAGLSNLLLIASGDELNYTQSIEDSLQEVWSLRDMGLTLKERSGKDYYDLLSSRIFIDTVVQRIVSRENIRYEEIITYLVNDIEVSNRHTPYSFASAVSPAISGSDLNENEVIVNRWTADDLDASVGDSVKLTYYEIGPLRKLYETSAGFIIKEIIENDARVDSTLMPKFQGLSEAGNCRDWDAGVPVDLKRIRDKDERYWDDYRGTPKVLMNLNKGKQLWENQFGSVTSMRFKESELQADSLAAILLKNISPGDLGLQVFNVQSEGASAADNAVNFTQLFLGMSFIVIAACILLTVLIYTLHFNSRSVETALLNGLGISRNLIIRMRIGETFLIILAGSITGALLGILYNHALIAGINTLWNDMVRMDILKAHVSLQSLLTGTLTGILIAIIPVYAVTVKKLKQPVAVIVKTGSQEKLPVAGNKQLFTAGGIMLAGSIVLIVISLLLGITDNAVLYLSSGVLILSGGLLVIYNLIKRHSRHTSNGVPGMLRLAYSNISRNPSRSLAVIALLATGTFSVVLTGAYRKTYHGTANIRESGTGGYLLWAKTTSPVLFDLNSPDGKERLIFSEIDDLSGVRFLQYPQLEGDDASCLNLNQAQRPSILAVDPAEFDSARAFSFVKLLNRNTAHPWLELETPVNDSTFPAFVDHTVLQYSLKKKLGDTLLYRNEAGKIIRLLISGTIDNSVFQGNILIADQVFLKHFPSSAGTRIILTDAPEEKLGTVTDILSQSLVDYGIEVTPTGERLATFNSVENTYLSVFMALSGLGLIIGTIGLGIVLLRNVQERRKELALLLSIGYRRTLVFRMIFTENFFLLVTGLGIGILAAFIAIMPSLISPAFDLQGGFIIILIAGIFISGVIWIWLPLHAAMRRQLIPELRKE